MPYVLADVELTRPLPALSLRGDQDGVGILVRRRGRPVAYVLWDLPGGAELDPERLADLLAAELRTALVGEALADTLTPPAEPVEPALTLVRGALGDEALREAATTWVGFVAPDAELDPEWHRGLAEALSEQPDVAAVTGLVLPQALETAAQVAFERAGGFHLGFEKARLAGDQRPEAPFHPVDPRPLGAAGNLVVRRDAALAAGGAGRGEADLLHRLLRAGHALAYEPRMLTFHARRPRPVAGARVLAAAVGAEPALRGRARRAAAWWAAQAARRLIAGPTRSDPRTRAMVLTELAGSVSALAPRPDA